MVGRVNHWSSGFVITVKEILMLNGSEKNFHCLILLIFSSPPVPLLIDFLALQWSKYHAEIPRPSVKLSARERLNRPKVGVEECRDEGRILYNTYLMVLSLKLGLEKPWVPEGFTGFNSKVSGDLG